MTEKRYKIESLISQLASQVAFDNDVEDDFYGDCYPDEIMDLENHMEHVEESEWEDLLMDAKEIFEGCVPDAE